MCQSDIEAKNILGNICKLYILPLREIHLDILTVTFTYYTDIFYLPLTNYIYYVNNLCQPVVFKTYLVIYVNYIYLVLIYETHRGRLTVNFAYYTYFHAIIFITYITCVMSTRC